MKNILFLFAAASLILATGCEEPEPEKTAEPQIFDFQVPEEEIEAFSARIIITCSDESLLWYYGLALSSDIAEDPDFAENARQSLLEYVKIMGGSYSLTDLLYPGDYIDDWTWTRLDMNSAYTPFAFGLDENGEFTTEFHYGPEFTTKDDQPTDAYAEGNFGDMYMEVTTLTEEGTCHDYALFDKYFNAVRSTSASAAAIRPRVKIPERPVPELSSFPKDRIMRRLLR